MEDIKYFDSSEFSLEKLKSIKNGRYVYVVFSTFGEREAEMIYDKISLLRSKLGEFIDAIFLSHRREGKEEELTERKAREAAPDVEIIMCNSYDVPDMGTERGKGADMRRTLYYINKKVKGELEGQEVIIVFLDADVLPQYFGVHFVLGLSGAVINGYNFAKASFWRAMGRVKKYVAQPLFSVIEHPDLKRLRGFAYPLSGEVAGTLEFFNSVSFWQIYGVETGIDIDACMGQYKVADVNLGLYDHEHHNDLSIQKMAFGIIRTYLLQLQNYGIIELKDGARVSNNFKEILIDENGERQSIEFDLTEKKYKPLNELLGT